MKFTTRLHLTPSTRSPLADPDPDRLDGIRAGSDAFPLGDRVREVALRRLLEDLQPLA